MPDICLEGHCVGLALHASQATVVYPTTDSLHAQGREMSKCLHSSWNMAHFTFTFIGYPSESASSSKWHAWFASRYPGGSLSTWPTTAVSCPTALGALCGQLTFRLAWCHKHSAVTATELLQPRDLACGTLFQSSCIIPTSPTDSSDDS